MLQVADAAAIIGDPALHAAVALEHGYLPMVHYDFDLGSLWRHQTGLPFVYALWTAPQDGDNLRVNSLLRTAAEWGMQHLDEIAEAEAPRTGLTVEFCRAYLHNNITYELGPREWEGLKLFRAHAAKLGLLPDSEHPITC
jgi:chorismate dehydratase